MGWGGGRGRLWLMRDFKYQRPATTHMCVQSSDVSSGLGMRVRRLAPVTIPLLPSLTTGCFIFNTYCIKNTLHFAKLCYFRRNCTTLFPISAFTQQIN